MSGPSIPDSLTIPLGDRRYVPSKTKSGVATVNDASQVSLTSSLFAATNVATAVAELDSEITALGASISVDQQGVMASFMPSDFILPEVDAARIIRFKGGSTYSRTELILGGESKKRYHFAMVDFDTPSNWSPSKIFYDVTYTMDSIQLGNFYLVVDVRVFPTGAGVHLNRTYSAHTAGFGISDSSYVQTVVLKLTPPTLADRRKKLSFVGAGAPVLPVGDETKTSSFGYRLDSTIAFRLSAGVLSTTSILLRPTGVPSSVNPLLALRLLSFTVRRELS